MGKEINDIAKILADIYFLKFGGKYKGRYSITRKNLLKMSNKRRMSEKFINDLKHTILEMGYAMIEVDETFKIIDLDVMGNYRRVPKNIVNIFDNID